jgi:hypothetical protein
MSSIIFYKEVSQFATITASSIKPNYSVESIRDNNPGCVFIAADGSMVFIEYEFPQPQALKGGLTLNHNLVNGDTFLFQGSNNDFQTFNEISILPGQDYFVVDWSFQKYRFKLQKVDATPVQIGLNYLSSSVYEFEDSYIYKYSFGNEKVWNSKTTDSGRIIRILKYSRKLFSCEFKDVGGNQRDIMDSIKDPYTCLILPDNKAYFGVQTISQPQKTGPGLHGFSLTFTESI